MKIHAIETFATDFIAVVKVTTDTFATGVGQVAPYHADITAQVLHRQVAPHAIGCEINHADDIAALVARIPEREHKFPGSYLMRALAGLDTALWDLLGKVAGKPVCELLGGEPGRLRAYASSMRRDITADAEAERLCKLRYEHGFDAFKFRIASECGHDADEWHGRTADIVKKMCAAMDDDVALLVDANSGYSPAKAVEVGHFLNDHGVCHFEEPCPYWELEQTREVTDALAEAAIEVAGGEQDCQLPTWRRMVDERVVNIVQPDVCYVGGVTRALQVAKVAAAAKLKCTPHSANLSMVTLFTMHFLRAIDNPGKYLEFSIEDDDYYPWQVGLFADHPYKVTEGSVAVTDAPGWGATINPAWLDAAAYQRTG